MPQENAITTVLKWSFNPSNPGHFSFKNGQQCIGAGILVIFDKYHAHLHLYLGLGGNLWRFAPFIIHFFINCLHLVSLGCDLPITTIDLFIYSTSNVWLATLNNWLNPIDKWALLVFHLSLEKWAQRCTMDRIDSDGSKKVETLNVLGSVIFWPVNKANERRRKKTWFFDRNADIPKWSEQMR